MNPRTRDAKEAWQDAEDFTRDLLNLLLRDGSRDLCGGAEGWRLLRSAYQQAAEERRDRFAFWQDREADEIHTLREESALIEARVNELRAEIAGRATR